MLVLLLKDRIIRLQSPATDTWDSNKTILTSISVQTFKNYGRIKNLIKLVHTTSSYYPSCDCTIKYFPDFFFTNEIRKIFSLFRLYCYEVYKKNILESNNGRPYLQPGTIRQFHSYRGNGCLTSIYYTLL